MAGRPSQYRFIAIFITLTFIVIYWFLNQSYSPLPASTLKSLKDSQWRWGWKSSSQAYVQVAEAIGKHPIDVLVEDAELKFKNLRKRQSESLDEAIREYKKRYHRPPPPGFESWFEEARKLNSRIIDDFDAIHDSLDPFWTLTAREIINRTQAVIDSKKWLDIYVIKDHNVDKGGPIGDWMKSYATYLPDMQIPYNILAESRVVFPYRNRTTKEPFCLPNITQKTNDSAYHFTNIGREPTWPYVIKSCKPGSPSLSRINGFQNETNELRFVNNVAAAKDLCHDPELRRQHGNLVSPDNTLLAPDLMPVFSRNKMSTFQDILVPTPAYRSRSLPNEELVPWEEKQNSLYWAGTTTGGFSHDGTWRFTQRFRFIQLLNDGKRPISLLRQVNGAWERYSTVVKTISKQVVAKFTKHKLCTPEDCKDQEKEPTVRFGKVESKTEFRNHTLTMDIDGQGSTDRYYMLLSSGSAVLKQTLMREWHDDRLIPWYHYIPISMHMEELPEVIRYLTLEEKGRNIARNIAEQGRQWWTEALRDEDMGLYMLRLLLEWARLIDKGRDEDLPACV